MGTELVTDNAGLEHTTTMEFLADMYFQKQWINKLTFKILKIKFIYHRDGSFIIIQINKYNFFKCINFSKSNEINREYIYTHTHTYDLLTSRYY